MTNSGGEEEDWTEGSGDEEEREEGDDDLIEVESSGLKSEDMTTVLKRKDLMWTEVAKNDQDSLLDHWFRDQIKPDTWDKIAQVFQQEDKCFPHQKWVLMTEDTKSPVPIRYQHYDITVKLTPDNHDKTHGTFETLTRTYPTLWVCCDHHCCMTVYDVTIVNDTHNFFLS